MHHKRKRPKASRAGCQLCKPHKRNGCGHAGKMDGVNMRSRKQAQKGAEQMKDKTGWMTGMGDG